MAAQFTGSDINAVLRTVKAIAPDDGDVQLSILTYALIAACKSIGIPPDRALQVIGETFENEAALRLIPWDQITTN